jgi:hypothetical protein
MVPVDPAERTLPALPPAARIVHLAYRLVVVPVGLLCVYIIVDQHPAMPLTGLVAGQSEDVGHGAPIEQDIPGAGDLGQDEVLGKLEHFLTQQHAYSKCDLVHSRPSCTVQNKTARSGNKRNQDALAHPP